MADGGFKVNKSINLNAQTSAPANPVDGDVYYDSTIGSFVYYHAGSWANLDSVGSVASAASMTSAQFTPSIVQNSVLRVTGSTAADIHGLTASFSGKQLVFFNNTTQNMNIRNQSATEATSNNRIVTPINADMVLVSGEIAQFVYDLTANRWMLVSVSSVAGAQVPATTSNNGLVRLNSNPEFPSAPRVVTVGIGGIANNSATSGDSAGFAGVGANAGPGILGTGGGTNGTGVVGNGGGTNSTGVTGNGAGTGSGVSGNGGGTVGVGVLGTGGSQGVGVQGQGLGVGTGVVGTGGATNGIGISGSGAGTGIGVTGTGGASGTSSTVFPPLGAGAYFVGGGNGNGVVGKGSGSGGRGGWFTGSNSGAGVLGEGDSVANTGNGVNGIGYGTGRGGSFQGGDTNGVGCRGVGGTGGTGHGVQGVGGAAAAGGDFTGGSTSGVGVIGTGTGTGVGGLFVPGGSSQYNAAISTSGNIRMTGPAITISTQHFNTISPMSFPKAWIYFRCNGTNNPTQIAGVNVNGIVQQTDGRIDISFAGGFATTAYMFMAQCGNFSTMHMREAGTLARTSGLIGLYIENSSGTIQTLATSGSNSLDFIVTFFGAQ